VTVAPGTTAPVASVTVPCIAPVDAVCAIMHGDRINSIAVTQKHKNFAFRFIIVIDPLLRSANFLSESYEALTECARALRY
jgi:hypothetical protein